MADDRVTEYGAFTADEELARDVVCSASFRGQTVTAEGCVLCAYLMGAGTPLRRYRTCSLFTKLRHLLPTLTVVFVVGSSSVRSST